MLEAILLYTALVGGIAICVTLARGFPALLLWLTTAAVWTFACPLFAGPPLILKSVDRGPYYGDALIPWASTTYTRPPRIVRARSEAETIAAVNAATHVRVVGSAHSFQDLFFTTETSLHLDYCDIGHDDKVIEVGAGCKIDRLREYARAQGLAVRGLGAIYQQSVGGSIATDLHGDEKLGFIDYVESIRLLDADGAVTEVENPDAGGLGQNGIILSAKIRCVDSFSVIRTFRDTSLAGALAAIRRVRSDESVAAGAQAAGTGIRSWNTWEMTTTDKKAADPVRSAGGEAWTFFIDNVLLPLNLLLPGVAGLGVALSPFVYYPAKDDVIDFYWAQQHPAVNMLPTGEINVKMDQCEAFVSRLEALAEPHGVLSLVIRPSEEGCWLDYSVIPWSPGSLNRFFDDVAKELLPDSVQYHTGKVGPRPPTGDTPKFEIIPTEPYSLDGRRVAWITLVVTTAAFTLAATGGDPNDAIYTRMS